jgi:hypothetical protein
MLIIENNKEYEFVDFFVYNKYIKTNLPEIDKTVAEYGINSFIYTTMNKTSIFLQYF